MWSKEGCTPGRVELVGVLTPADRLERLGALASGSQTYGPEPLEERAAADLLLDALPELVAVVRATEYVRDAWLIIEADDAHLMNACAKLDAALAALDAELSKQDAREEKA